MLRSSAALLGSAALAACGTTSRAKIENGVINAAAGSAVVVGSLVAGGVWFDDTCQNGDCELERPLAIGLGGALVGYAFLVAGIIGIGEGTYEEMRMHRERQLEEHNRRLREDATPVVPPPGAPPLEEPAGSVEDEVSSAERAAPGSASAGGFAASRAQLRQPSGQGPER
jgi:hypothetical protein